MKDNKGFTLVEIIAVIAIIGILALIIIPGIDSIIKSSNDDVYELQLGVIKDGLKHYAAANVLTMPSNEDETFTITLGDVKKAGYLDVDIRNPKTEECFNNDIVLKITMKNKKYVYEIDESTIGFNDSETCEVVGE